MDLITIFFIKNSKIQFILYLGKTKKSFHMCVKEYKINLMKGIIAKIK